MQIPHGLGWRVQAIMVAVGLVFPLAASHAAVISGSYSQNTSQTTDPSAYSSAPTGNAGWANVGWGGTGIASGSAGSAVYLGNGWALTANHTYSGSIRLGANSDGSGGTVYTASTSYKLKNPSDGSVTDLRLYKLSSTPNIPAVTIASNSPSDRQAAMIIGTGLDRGSSLQSYNVQDPQGHTGTVDGFNWGTTRVKTYSNTTVTATGLHYAANSFGPAAFTGFSMNFVNSTGQGVVADKDSGGAIFTYDTSNGQWQLGGIVEGITNVLIGPNNAYTAVQFGGGSGTTGGFQMAPSVSVAIDLSVYRSQIESYMNTPAPASAALLLAAVPLLLLRRRRTRA